MKPTFTCLTLVAALLCPFDASAEAPISLAGKTITVIVAYAPGGGVDAAGRFITSYLVKELPGRPDFIVQNRPGADGMTAANYFAQQVKPDGMTFLIGSGGITSPVSYRTPQAKYDPAIFQYFGGVARTGSVILVNAEAAKKRLLTKGAEPAIMGAHGSTPNPSQQMAAWGIEFLGWNAKWVMGYPGTSQVALALERGEIDMTATSNVDLVRRLTKDGKFVAVTQTGAWSDGKVTVRPEFNGIPLFAEMMKGKTNEPIQKNGLDYWFALQKVSTWFALPPGTPKAIVDMYRDAFKKLALDPAFIAESKKMAEDFTTQTGEDVEEAILTVDRTSDETLKYVSDMLLRQGAGAPP
jgi:tripartite-type tricarboxylate transporter receptor subunit TctC